MTFQRDNSDFWWDFSGNIGPLFHFLILIMPRHHHYALCQHHYLVESGYIWRGLYTYFLSCGNRTSKTRHGPVQVLSCWVQGFRERFTTWSFCDRYISFLFFFIATCVVHTESTAEEIQEQRKEGRKEGKEKGRDEGRQKGGRKKGRQAERKKERKKEQVSRDAYLTSWR